MALKASQQKFIDDNMAYAQQASAATGVDPIVILTQAAHESAWGTKAPGNNFFGIKGKGQTFATHENVGGKSVATKGSFRKYDSPLQSFMDWAKLIGTKDRYAAVKDAKTPEAAFAALKAAGYATDPKYASKLAGVAKFIKEGFLRAGGAPSVTGGSLNLTGGVLRQGMGTKRSGGPSSDVRDLQQRLNRAGADLKVDGIFGSNTRQAVRAFQGAHGLDVDGVFGPQSFQKLDAIVPSSTAPYSGPPNPRTQAPPAYSGPPNGRVAARATALPPLVPPSGNQQPAGPDPRAGAQSAPGMTGAADIIKSMGYPAATEAQRLAALQAHNPPATVAVNASPRPPLGVNTNTPPLPPGGLPALAAKSQINLANAQASPPANVPPALPPLATNMNMPARPGQTMIPPSVAPAMPSPAPAQSGGGGGGQPPLLQALMGLIGATRGAAVGSAQAAPSPPAAHSSGTPSPIATPTTPRPGGSSSGTFSGNPSPAASSVSKPAATPLAHPGQSMSAPAPTPSKPLGQGGIGHA